MNVQINVPATGMWDCWYAFSELGLLDLPVRDGLASKVMLL